MAQASAPATCTLILRNLTPAPLTLRAVERFRVAVPTHHSNGTTADTRAGSAAVSVDRDVFVAVGAFDVVDTGILVSVVADLGNHGAGDGHEEREEEVLRLTLVVGNDGDTFTVWTPVLPDAPGLQAVSANPKYHLSAIYVVPSPFPSRAAPISHAHLAILPMYDSSCWLARLPDVISLSALSIPGTHNTPTCHRALPSVRCQSVSPAAQLAGGVRFFDVRAHPDSGGRLRLVHAKFSVALSGARFLDELVADILTFLDDNPSETLILSLKREGPGTHDDVLLSRVLAANYIARAPDRWYTRARVPRLGEARGKIVLLRRFVADKRLLERANGGDGWGIDATGWADNPAAATCPSGKVCVQDFYRVMETATIERKVHYVVEHIKRAGDGFGGGSASGSKSGSGSSSGVMATTVAALNNRPLFLNFLSASNFWRAATWPEKIAARLNPITTAYLVALHHRPNNDLCTGILVCDWVGHGGDWELVRAIIAMNGHLMA